MIENQIHENCGVVGVIAPKGVNSSSIAAKVGAELQHRGQEGGGMGTKKNGGNFNVYKEGRRFGLAFSSDRTLRKRHLVGEISLAHTRYRTTGPANDIDYTQPMLVEENGRTMMGGHNGT